MSVRPLAHWLLRTPKIGAWRAATAAQSSGVQGSGAPVAYEAVSTYARSPCIVHASSGSVVRQRIRIGSPGT